MLPQPINIDPNGSLCRELKASRRNQPRSTGPKLYKPRAVTVRRQARNLPGQLQLFDDLPIDHLKKREKK